MVHGLHMTHIHFNIAKMMTHIMIHVGFHAFWSGRVMTHCISCLVMFDCLPNDPHWVCL